MTSLINTAALHGAGKAPVSVPVRTKKAQPLTPYQQLVAQNKQPWPTLPGGVSPTKLMTGLMNRDWTQAAQTALAPAFKQGMNTVNLTLQQALAQGNAQARALQGAYTAAGGQMPRVGSEYSSLGGVLSDIGKALAPGMGTPTYSDELGRVGAAPAQVPLPDQAGAAYTFGSAPGQALAQSGYYKDIGTAGAAAAEQMQGREQAMVLQRKAQSDAIQEYLKGAMGLSTEMLGKVPETAVALSGEARARAAGALSGLQFATEQRANIQKLLLQYAQMRADAKTAGQKLALDKWAQNSLDTYRGQMASAAQTRAQTAAKKATQPKPLSQSDKARLSKLATTLYNGMAPHYHAVDVRQTDPTTGQVSVTTRWEPVPGTGAAPALWDDAVAQLIAAGAPSRGAAIQMLEAQGWKRGEGGRPPTVAQNQAAKAVAQTASGGNPFGLATPPGMFGTNWPNYGA